MSNTAHHSQNRSFSCSSLVKISNQQILMPIILPYIHSLSIKLLILSRNSISSFLALQVQLHALYDGFPNRLNYSPYGRSLQPGLSKRRRRKSG